MSLSTLEQNIARRNSEEASYSLVRRLGFCALSWKGLDDEAEAVYHDMLEMGRSVPELEAEERLIEKWEILEFLGDGDYGNVNTSEWEDSKPTGFKRYKLQTMATRISEDYRGFFLLKGKVVCLPNNYKSLTGC